MTQSPILITIVTGFLGSGKTTLILNLVAQLPGTKFAILKNEFGDVAVDSQLAATSAIQGVQELLNGCICCNQVGQLSDALADLASTAHPDRILIETSGSAFPATLALEISRLSQSTGGRYALDGVVCVLDVANWKGYSDTSYTAKLQARCTDLVVLNKWEEAGERAVEDCVDRVGDLDVPVAKERSDRGWVDARVVFGLDVRGLRRDWGAGSVKQVAAEEDSHAGHGHENGHQSEIEVLSVRMEKVEGGVDVVRLQELLEQAPKDEVYRIKALLVTSGNPKSSDGEPADASEEIFPEKDDKRYVLNWAFGRWKYTYIGERGQATKNPPPLQMTIMTARGEALPWKKRIENKELIRAEDGNPKIEIKKVA
ncbi:MAG: hypothetical protein M1822_003103 [Bathelium mastoideum]|nr:MAG: hypothetical protein M1822_003103 [Bathelium mastoideum]